MFYFVVIQHSTPALELELSWFPTYMKPEELRRLHRPYLKPMRTGPHSEPVFKPVYSLERYVRRKENVCQFDFYSIFSNCFHFSHPNFTVLYYR